MSYRALLAALLLLPLLGKSPARATAAEASRPNIVFVLVDDLGIGQVGAYRQNKIQTPRLDRMAAEGMKFTDAYAGNTVCSPSRLSLFTGRDGRLMHLNSNAVKIRPEDYTFAHLLRDAGYTTHLVGKCGIADEVGVNDPFTMGFDSYFGVLNNVAAHRNYPTRLWRDNQPVELPENAEGAKGTLAHDLYTQEALDFISQPRTEPFLLFLAYTFPHAELAAPADLIEAYSHLPEEPYVGMTTGEPLDVYTRYYPEYVPHRHATLAAMVAAIDRDVGRVLDTLDAHGLGEDTIVIFATDNGPHREGGADPDFFDAAAPFRGTKRDLLEGGIRTPFIVRWPAAIAAGSVNRNPVAFWDMLPTFAELVEHDPAGEAGFATNGISLLDTMTHGTPLPERRMYWELQLRLNASGQPGFRQAMRYGPWKAMRYGQENPVELYHLTTDPNEAYDVAGREPERAADFRREFDAIIAER